GPLAGGAEQTVREIAIENLTDCLTEVAAWARPGRDGRGRAPIIDVAHELASLIPGTRRARPADSSSRRGEPDAKSAGAASGLESGESCAGRGDACGASGPGGARSTTARPPPPGRSRAVPGAAPRRSGRDSAGHEGERSARRWPLR